MDALVAQTFRGLVDDELAGVRAEIAYEEDAAGRLARMIDGISAHALTRGTDAALFAIRLAQASETLVGAEPGTIVERLS